MSNLRDLHCSDGRICDDDPGPNLGGARWSLCVAGGSGGFRQPAALKARDVKAVFDVPVSWLDGAGVGISGLETLWGRLSYTLRRQGDRLRLRLHADALTPGGFVLKWPYPGAPGRAMANGHEAVW